MSQSNEDKPNLDRRRFVQGTGALAVGSAGVVLATGNQAETHNPSCKTPGCDYDVVVIGGGFAGAAASRDCSENGFKTLLLEARNRIGGRTFTSTFAGHEIELGGLWIHWTQPFVWAEKERYNLEVNETPGAVPDSILMHDAGSTRELTEAELLEVQSAYSALTAEARDVLPQPFDIRRNWSGVLEADKLSAMDMLNQLDLNPVQRVAMESICAGSSHNFAENWGYVDVMRWTALAGYGDFSLMLDSGARFKLKKGTVALAQAMLEDGKSEVRLSTVVKKVEDLGAKVRITTTSGETVTAGAAICTVPMNVLPAIEFSPALDKRISKAAKTGHTGVGVKLFIKCPGKQGNIYCMARQSHPLPVVFTYYEGEDHTLFCSFANDPQAIDYYDEDAVQNALRDFLPGVEVESVALYDWVLDPYSRGTWAQYRPGWISEYLDVFDKDMGRILFGSGDHGEGWRGFIDGAIGAGIRAAERVKKVLR